MGVILQASYRRQADPTVSVPAPSDGHGDPFWYDHLASQCGAFAQAGFTHLQLPPVHMTIGGATATSDGYGVYNEYDLGSEARPTRFGTAERLQRLSAIAKRNGLNLLADWVPHQRYGGDRGVYAYPSATGPKNGRFPKQPACFFSGTTPGGVPRDPIAGPIADDFGFGDELCPINARPQDYVMNGLIDAGDWLYRRLDLDGCRNDDTKGQALQAVNRWVNTKAMAGKPVIGEYASGNRNDLRWWVSETGLRCYTYDFGIKYALQNMCNNGSRWDMTQLPSSGLASFGWPWSMSAVTFIENADSDTNGFGSVVFNKLLGYAFLLTAEGWPSIYYRDYSTDKYCYGLKPKLDNLIWIHENLANGPTIWRHAEYQFAVYERASSPGLLVGLNNDIWGGWKRVTVATSFGPHVRLHDYTGHSDDQWTDAYGNVTIWIPPNDNGAGYVCFAPVGFSKPNAISGKSATQVFEGADDLDIPPASPTWTHVQRIWCDASTYVRLKPAETKTVTTRLVDSSGVELPAVSSTASLQTYRAARAGWYTIEARSLTASPESFHISTTYTGTVTL
jgi:alpha-amylase